MPHTLFLASYAPGGSLSDPAGSSAIVAAVTWLQQTLLGTVATTVAIIAVASIGFMMLSGRVNLRHGLTVIAGAFILFGASAIVAGLQTSLAGAGLAAAPLPRAPESPPLPPAPPGNRDPYAGASVPER
jgi:type IV secretory pathway VirB2 component (pilin)